MPTSLKLGVVVPYVHEVVTSGAAMSEFAETIEAHGAESVWAVEHVIEAEAYEPLYPYSASGHMPGRFTPMADPLEILAFLAASTSTLTLGTSVMVAPLHSPVILAKRVATIACLSGNRMLLGLGIGWQKEEYSSVGIPYTNRGPRLDECIAAMRELWAHRPASYHGNFVDFETIHLVPPPPHGDVPIIVGGNSKAAVTRAARTANGWYPHAISPTDFADAARLFRAEAHNASRSPADIPITITPRNSDQDREMDLDWVQHFVTHGATRLVIGSGITRPDEIDAVRIRIEQYRERVMDRLVLPEVS